MKIEIDLVKEMLEAVKAENTKPVDDSQLLKDAYDKMFNFGVSRMYHAMLTKLYEAEMAVRGIEK